MPTLTDIKAAVADLESAQADISRYNSILANFNSIIPPWNFTIDTNLGKQICTLYIRPDDAKALVLAKLNEAQASLKEAMATLGITNASP